jgi:hypothetical protein
MTSLDDVIKDANVVSLAQLHDQVPEETAWVTPEDRAAQLDARHASYNRRLDLP